jgi:hypothetical protein
MAHTRLRTDPFARIIKALRPVCNPLMKFNKKSDTQTRFNGFDIPSPPFIRGRLQAIL